MLEVKILKIISSTTRKRKENTFVTLKNILSAITIDEADFR